MYFLAGTDISISLAFKVNGEFVVPDTSSVVYTVRDQAGAPMAGLTSVALPTTADQTSATVVVPAGSNALTGDLSRRSVDYVWTVGGQAFRLVTSYQLIGWLNYTATPDDVRGYIGVDAGELPDADVDLVAAYFEVATAVTKTVFDAELARTDVRAARASRAVMLRAVLAVMPSLQLRSAKAQQSDTNQFERLSGIDLEGLWQQASAELSDITTAMTGGKTAAPSTLALSTPTDPITG